MTKEELRKVFDEAEKRVCMAEVREKIVADLTDTAKMPPTNAVEFALRVNRILDREIFLEVLATILADK